MKGFGGQDERAAVVDMMVRMNRSRRTWGEILLQDEVAALLRPPVPLAECNYLSCQSMLSFIERNARLAHLTAMSAFGGGYDDERYAEMVRWCHPRLDEEPVEWIRRTPFVVALRSRMEALVEEVTA